MKSMLTLSEPELKTLQELIKQNKQGKTVYRAVMILLLNFFSLSTVASVLAVPKRTVYDRLTRYQAEQSASLPDKARPGRPKKLSPQQEQGLFQLVSEKPLQSGYCWNYWTCRTLSLHLRKHWGISLSPEGIRGYLKRHQKSWKKPRYKVNSPDPLKEQKLQRIEDVRQNLAQEEVLLYSDESDFNLFCPLRNCWQTKGDQIEVDTPGKNQKVYAFGAYDSYSGRLIYETHTRKRTAEFLHFLNHLLSVYPNKKVYLVLDNYCVHHAKRTQSFVEKNKDRLEFLFLPTYAPQYNHIERLWGTVKNWVNSNHLYADKQELLKGTRRGLRQFQLEWRAAQAA